MNKTEFISGLALKTGSTKKDTEKFLDTILDAISEILAHGDKLQLTGFGIFEPVERAARECRNPQTGQIMQLPASNSVKFKPGKNLKDAVNKK